MSPDTLFLAQSLVSLARDPQYAPENAAARVAVIIGQIQSAALSEITDPMAEMAHAGCIINLAYGPYGWSCSYMSPEADRIPGRKGKIPAEAVRRAYETWKTTQGTPEEEIA